ncbi:WapI family immunity protein [Lelliottia aquatilis]|uniref:WapI family immunity protein n=1 Tax=Lelliottia aquatilis TaxID=2080838 RepID=UPI000CDECBD9|nr:hypothetical protein [Lelliottia aquatilis]MBL5886210.1 hypothetical protein [Lelliottia aquatilis]POZ15564.1 hypothetical protein C3Z09_13890 [Lelliottia aquatilis]
MLQIIHNEVTLAITPYEKLTNTSEKGFYHEYLNMYVEFKSKGISLDTIWDCYIGELEEFHTQLIELRDNIVEKEITFSPMEGMISLTVGKNIQSHESYYLKFKLSTEVRSDIFVEGIIGMDQTYIHEIIHGVRQLINF